MKDGWVTLGRSGESHSFRAVASVRSVRTVRMTSFKRSSPGYCSACNRSLAIMGSAHSFSQPINCFRASGQVSAHSITLRP